jgi:choline dehydrogenase
VEDQYHYIIIGAGSAGCVLANRLCADPACSVLLVEGGPGDRDTMIQMPRGIGKILNPGSQYIWEYQAYPGANLPAERWFKGKVLGGSSSVNGMVYMRGAPMDYDGWQAMGCKGWGWSNIGAKFKELEDHDQAPAQWRGSGGPLKVSTHPKGDPLCEAVIAAAEQMGVPRVDDVNELDAVRDGGIAYQAATIWDGKRFSAAKAFLDPIRGRRNLEILTETVALRLEFEGKRAAAVKLRNRTGVRSVRATREVILCAGAIETPKLLQLSGIGAAPLLKSHGIEVVAESPNVGRNLREHRHFDVQFRVRSHSHNTRLSGLPLIGSLLRYFLTSTGPMTHSAHEVGAFAKSEPGLDHADTQFGLMLVSTSSSLAGSELSLDRFPGITFLGYFTRPKSQGEVRIQSSDPDAPPYINANHLDAEEDRKKAVAVIRWLRQLGQQSALKDWIVEETVPGPSVQTDEQILARAISMGGTCFHICGTARMGADEGSVVDSRLRVRGVDGLRVVDTSIMPTIVSGNTNAPAMVIGMRAADFILEDRNS